MKKHFFCIPFASLLIIFSSLANFMTAQIHVVSTGRVGIGETNPIAKMDVVGDTLDMYTLFLSNNSNNGFLKVGMINNVNSQGAGARLTSINQSYGSANLGSAAYGTYTSATTYGNGGYGGSFYLNSMGGSGTKYGLYTHIQCGSNDGTGSRYALYASTGCNTGYAGYFVGDVYVQGTLTQTSDASKKTNVQALSGALGLISQLRPKTYDFKTAENPGLPTEKQYGFLAQDLERVLPALVKDVESYHESDELDENGLLKTPEVNGTIKTVNYMALIPILVEGMQEQQALIEEQNRELARQAEEIRQLKELSRR